jgi:hypothetical protein
VGKARWNTSSDGVGYDFFLASTSRIWSTFRHPQGRRGAQPPPAAFRQQLRPDANPSFPWLVALCIICRGATVNERRLLWPKSRRDPNWSLRSCWARPPTSSVRCRQPSAVGPPLILTAICDSPFGILRTCQGTACRQPTEATVRFCAAANMLTRILSSSLPAKTCCVHFLPCSSSGG